MPDQSQPYVGPIPFKREDAPLFFGRDREASELRSLIISHSEVLLYAQSGAGKTSLINTKLWTLLEDEDLEMLPLASVRAPPPSTPPKTKITNIYVFNTLLNWANNTATADELAGMTFREFLQRREQPLDEEGLPKSCVAIFDQFEELFTSYPECWQQRPDFFLQVRDALDANPRMRALFAMREDYVAAIDQYSTIMPEKFRVRFHLENLRKDQAIEAIEGPLTRGQNRHFADGVAEKLAKELMKVQVETASGRAQAITGEFVEPVQLQVVCDRLWRDLKPEDTEITLAHLETISVERALLSFYEQSIEDVARETGIDKSILRSWFEQKLVTPAGTRGMVFRGETETAGMRNDAVDAFDRRHLIRSELRDGRRWYELTHDRFIDAIQKSRQKLLQNLQAGAEETRRQLEAKAADWVRLGRKKSGLLRDVELREAQRWLESPAAAALGSSERLVGLVEASRADVQERSARRRKGWLIVLGTACLITLLGAGYAEHQREEASRQREIAEVGAEITLARNLAARSLKYRSSDLGLALLLNLEANRIADEIIPKTPLQIETKNSLLAEVKGGLLSGLVVSPRLRMFLHGHTETVRGVAFSPDGQILATGGYDGKVILWDLQGYPLGPPLSGHTNIISSVAFGPDGKKVASCGADGNIILWDVEKHEQIRSVPVGEGTLYSVAFSPDGNTLACATQSGSVVILDIEGRGEMDKLPGHTGHVYSVAFSPDGKKLASGGQDKKIVFWDFARRTPDWFVDDNNEVFSVAFSPDGKTLASGNRSGEVRLWNVARRERLGLPLNQHTNGVFGVAFSPDGKTLVSASADTTIRRWDVTNGKPIGEPLTGSSEQLYSVAFNPNGRILASGADRGVIVLWDTEQSLLAQPISLAWVYRMTFTRNGKTMAASDFKGNITVVGENVNEKFQAYQDHQEKVTSLAFNSDDTALASASEDGSIQLRTWNGETWNSSPKLLAKPGKSIESVAFSPTDSTMLASAGDDGLITFWDISSGKQIGTTPKQGRKVNTLAFSPDGKTLASGSDDGTIVLWNVAKREPLGPPLAGHTNEVFTVAFSPDGKTLASGAKDTTVILWDVVTGKPLDLPFHEHTGTVWAVAFSPDGKTLASCSYDKSIILWDVAAGESIGQLVTENQDYVFAVAFSPDGQLISAGPGVTSWDVRPESLRRNAEQIAARNLTSEEWKRFLGERSYRPTCPNGSLKKADMLALKGEVEKARRAFEQLAAVAIQTKAAAELDNSVGWYGSLDGFAKIVLPACDRAVELTKGEDSNYRDTRGLARAMTGKFPEATEDFRAVVIWLKTEEEKVKKVEEESSSQAEKEKHGRMAAEWKKLRIEREEWIAKLKSGQNPFDKETLKAIRREHPPTSD
jgi:WD40 repeat protein